MKGFWTPARIAGLKYYHGKGFSASQIAKEIGAVSRDAVLGKMFRLGMCSPDPVKRDRDASLEKYRSRQRRMNVKRREKRHAAQPRLSELYQTREERQRAALARAQEKKRIREMMEARGAAKTSAVYRTHMPRIGEMSKSQLRAMITQAVQNTAALS